MVKVLNLFGDSYSGQAGKAGVFAKWKGRQYRRKYVIPANPKTAMQMAVRGYFTNAVDFWHTLMSIQRRVFSYLATGLVMSGFNLLVSRWQKAATTGATLPAEPLSGIKQICSASSSEEDANVITPQPFTLGAAPVVIGSLAYVPKVGDDETYEMDAIIDLDMGDVRIPVAITTVKGATAGGENVAAGDKLLISYTSGGREVVREALFTAITTSFPAKATIAAAYRTAFWPIDLESVVVEIWDESLNEYWQIESLEVLNSAYSMVDTTPTPYAKIYFDKNVPTSAETKVTYTAITPISGAKLEVTKVDTSFITWRDYSDPCGAIALAQTVEDQAYDWRLSAPTYVSIIRAAQSAILATNHEKVTMTAA